MLLEPLSFTYSESTQQNFQGTKRELGKKLQEGFQVVRGGNGSYVLQKPSEALVKVSINGEIENIDVKEIIRDEYDKKRVTEKAFRVFEEDLKSGKKQLHYEGEVIVK